MNNACADFKTSYAVLKSTHATMTLCKYTSWTKKVKPNSRKRNQFLPFFHPFSRLRPSSVTGPEGNGRFSLPPARSMRFFPRRDPSVPPRHFNENDRSRSDGTFSRFQSRTDRDEGIRSSVGSPQVNSPFESNSMIFDAENPGFSENCTSAQPDRGMPPLFA